MKFGSYAGSRARGRCSLASRGAGRRSPSQRWRSSCRNRWAASGGTCETRTMDTAAGALGGGVAVVAVGTEGTELTQCKSLASWGASSSDYELAAPFGKERSLSLRRKQKERRSIRTRLCTSPGRCQVERALLWTPTPTPISKLQLPCWQRTRPACASKGAEGETTAGKPSDR